MFDEEYQKLEAFRQIVNNYEIIFKPKGDNIEVTIEDMETLQEYNYCITSADLEKTKLLAGFFERPVDLLSSFQSMFQKGLNKIIVKENGVFSLGFDLRYGYKKRIEVIQCKAERKKYQNRWSCTMKDKSFKLLGDNIIQGRNMPSYKLALVEKVLPKDRITKWKLKQIKFSKSWVAVGMCLKSVVLKNQYSINGVKQINKLGHGCYLNGWEMYVYSHSDPNINAKQISTVGFLAYNQVIIMQFNPMRDTLTFTNEPQGTVYTMPVPKVEGDDYHPCIAGRADGEERYFQWQLLQIQE